MPLGALCLDLQSFHVLRLEPDRAFLFFPTKSSRQKLQIRAPDLGNRGPRVSGRSGGPCFIPRLQTQHCVAPHQRDSPWCYSPPDPAQPAFGRSQVVPKSPPAKPSAPGEQKWGLAAAHTSPVPTAGDGDHLLQGWVSCTPGSPRVTGLEPHRLPGNSPRANTSLRPENERPGEGRRCKELRATLVS